jgi:hypothetical protein
MDAASREFRIFMPHIDPVNYRTTIWRLAAHFLLACFLANAANKFFVADLDIEAIQGAYAKIFAGQGDAPDQYRILPLLPLSALCSWLPFNTAVLLYNVVFGFLTLELLWAIVPGVAEGRKYALSILFAGAYIYCQYTGWRPDTMGMVFLASMSAWAALRLPASAWRDGLLLLLVVALSFSRADMALALAVILSAYFLRTLPVRIALPLLPLGIQALLQWGIFPDARYYTKPVMIWDNLSGYYLVRNPATYLILAVLLIYRLPLLQFARFLWKLYPIVCLVLIGYLGLVLVVGRVNEYRLYLPFLPFIWAYWNQFRHHEKEADPV